MSLLAISLLASAAANDGLSVYKCRNLVGAQEFVLSYETSGNRVRDVGVFIDGVPRIADDRETEWRGSIEPDGVRFQYSNVRNRMGTTGSMFLRWESPDERKARLTWNSVFGGGHIFMEEEKQVADCEMFVPQASLPQ